MGPTEAFPSPAGERSKRRRLWQVAAGLLVLVVALVAFASWQGGDEASDGPLSAVAAAAERTQRQPGAYATMRGTVSSPDESLHVTITGELVLDIRANRAEGTMAMTKRESGDSVELEFVGDGTMAYYSSSMFDSLPEGREWVGIDLALGEDLKSLVPVSFDPKAEMELLESEAAAGEVRKLGEEDVRGVPTTLYRGTMSVSEQAERLRDEGGDDLASLVEEEGSPVRFEVWVGADRLVRRTRIVSTQEGEGGHGPATLDIQVEFFDFGPVPAIEVPDADEVYDVTSRAREEIDAANAG